MHTTNSGLPAEHRIVAVPATNSPTNPVPARGSRSSLSVTSRPELPALLPSAVRSADRAGSDTMLPTPLEEKEKEKEKETDGTGLKTTPAAGGGAKRTRDGKDGPERKQSGAGKSRRATASDKTTPTKTEAAKPPEIEGTSPRPRKRPRKTSRVQQPGSADDIVRQDQVVTPRGRASSGPALSPGNLSPRSESGSPTGWKHGAQSPRTESSGRAFITLSPRRSSIPTSPDRSMAARLSERAPDDRPAPADASLYEQILRNEEFTFAGCESDEDGIIRADSGPARSLAGTDRPGAAGMTASPLKERSVRNVASATAGDVMPPRQAPQAQTALAPELTTLLDELDAALDDPIGS